MCFDVKQDAKKKERALPEINEDTDLSQFFTRSCKHPARVDYIKKMKLDSGSADRYNVLWEAFEF